MHTTPTLLSLVAELGGMLRHRFFEMLAADELMILTGLGALLTRSLLVSVVLFAVSLFAWSWC